MPPPKHAGIAWRIACDNDLNVTIAVTEKCILLFSDEPGHTAPWRIGYYSTMDEAHTRSVEMTNSYERLRNGTVTASTGFIVPESEWANTLRTGVVEDRVVESILGSLDDAQFES